MLGQGMRRTAGLFAILRNRELRAFWLSDWISDAGSFVTFIALAVYVNQLTGSPAAVGVALGLRSVPWFTLGPFAGVVADRMDRRRSEEHTSELQSRPHLVCRLLLEKKKKT